MKTPSDTIAITGGTGLIGSAISHTLRRRGHRVATISRGRSSRPDIVDDLGDAERLRELFMARGVTIVVHCAWEGDPRSAQYDYAGQITSNVAPALRLGIAAGEAGVKTVILLSSGGGLVGQENARLPAYGWAKLQVEAGVATSADIFGFELVTFRPTAVYGLAQDPSRPVGAIGVFAHRLVRRQTIEIFGSLDRSRDFLHVDDLADLVGAAVEHPRPGVYEAGGPEILSLGAVVALLAKAARVRPDLVIRPSGEIDPPSISLDNSAAAAAFGWSPHRRLADEALRLVAAIQPTPRSRA